MGGLGFVGCCVVFFVSVCGFFIFPLSFHTGGYSDCLLVTSWSTRTTHLILVCTHFFLICLGCCHYLFSPSGAGFWYAGDIPSKSSAVTAGSARLAVQTVFLVVPCLNDRRSIDWLVLMYLLLLLPALIFRHE